MKRIPEYLQSSTSECGLACLAMVAGSLIDNGISLASLRLRFPPSARGANLKALIDISDQIGLVARPLRVELKYLPQMSTPSILHWNHDHFVVLVKASRRGIWIIDPALGRRFLDWEESSKRVTGVALEFSKKSSSSELELRQSPRLRLSDLVGQIDGLKKAIAPAILAALALEVFVLVGPMYMRIVTDEVVGSGNSDLLLGLAIGFGLLVVFQVLAGVVRSWSLLYLSSIVNFQWQSSLLGRVLRLPISFFKVRSLADVASRFNGVTGIQRILTSVTIEIVLDGLMGIVVVFMMFVLAPSIAWIAILSTAIVLIFRLAVQNRIRRLTESNLVSLADQQGHFFDTARSIQSIKIFNREAIRASQWSNALSRSISSNAKLERASISNHSFGSITFGLERVLTIFLSAMLVFDGRQTLGTLIAYLAYRDLFAGRVSNLIQSSLEFRTVRVLIDRLADFLLTEPEPNPDYVYSDRFNSSIHVEGLSFAYSGDDLLTINDLSFGVAKGEHVVITGPSGCGKSTLINLLLGLLVPTRGTVHIGGIDILNSPPKAWRGYVSAVLQDDVLYNASILENVSFFDMSPEINTVENCLAQADVLDEVLSFPMGLNTRVGEMGGTLSGGQKQRLLIARALYAKPKILFLDESTSHISESSERRILHSILSLGLTVVSVAHRQESVQAADRVVELK